MSYPKQGSVDPIFRQCKRNVWFNLDMEINGGVIVTAIVAVSM